MGETLPVEKKEKRITINVKYVTKAKIEKYLAKIGWKLVHHGCEHYMFYDCYGKMSELVLLFGERIENESWRKSGTFGNIKGSAGCHNGSMAFYLKDINMRFNSGWGYPSVTFFPKGHKLCWIDLWDTRERKNEK
jgi:hypothetical protein